MLVRSRAFWVAKRRNDENVIVYAASFFFVYKFVDYNRESIFEFAQNAHHTQQQCNGGVILFGSLARLFNLQPFSFLSTTI